MDNDDLPIGRILTRREALALLGVAGAGMLAACASPTTATQTSSTSTASATSPATPTATTAATTATVAQATAVPACVVIPELTEGPYFVDVKLNRSDITTDTTTGAVKEGMPLEVVFNVSKIANGACNALEGAMVDIWHCDASGVYSAVQDPGFDTSDQNWLRGYQLTDANGIARFESIYPGWYSGRTVHIHFKIRTTGTDGNDYEFTSQLFFDEGVTAKVYANAPYNSKGTQDTTNATDGIYQDETLLTPTQNGTGYTATLNIALDLSDTEVGASDSAGGGDGRPGGGGPGGPP